MFLFKTFFHQTVTLLNRRTLNIVLWSLLICIVPLKSYPYKDLRLESPVVKAVQATKDAVVNISSEYEMESHKYPFHSFGSDSFFDSFFKDFFEPRRERNTKRTSLGSGVIIDGKRGFVLTNAHVIANTGTIHVALKNDREFKAEIVGADSDSDLAVLKITSTESLPSIEMGDSDDLMIGETVIAIGNPFGFSNTVTTGVISALNRSIRTKNLVYRDFIQTDASINPGNSGGPLLNIYGQLIGINTAIYAKAQGIGFAIPINKAKRIVTDLIKYGEVIRAWIGITVQTIDPGLSQYLNLTDKKGVLIKHVMPKSPAVRSGLVAGDIILTIGSLRISDTEDYKSALKGAAAGDEIVITFLRKGVEKSARVKSSAFPLAAAIDLAYQLFGIKVTALPNMGKGVLVSEMAPNTHLVKIGVRPGDIIRKLNEITVSDIEDFKKAVVEYREKASVVMLIQRHGYLYHISVKIQ
jgi:Do/DeqQ family serine protease